MSGDKSHWEEHNDHSDSHGASDPLSDDVLTASFHEVDEEPVPAKKAGGRGVSPRILAVLLMFVVLGGAGFAFLKMKARNNPGDEAPLATMASTDPVQQGNTGMTLGGPTNGSADLLGSVPPPQQTAAPQEMASAFVPDNSPGAGGMGAGAGQGLQQAPAGQAPMQQQPTAPAQPQIVGQSASQDAAQVAALTTQMDYMQKEIARVNAENQQLREKAKGSANQPSRAATVSVEKSVKPAAPKPQRSAKGSNHAKNSSGGRGNKVPDDQVITEPRESKLASLSVRAIYPMNGRNARAWINVGDDLVEVSAGSTVAGVYVKSIRPEAMEVVTDSGVIRAQR